MAEKKAEEDVVVELRDPISGENERVQGESEENRDTAIRESLNLDKLSETQIFEKGVIGLNTTSNNNPSAPSTPSSIESIPATESSKDVENPMQRRYMNEGLKSSIICSR